MTVAFILQFTPQAVPSVMAFKMFSPRNLMEKVSEEIKRRRAVSEEFNHFCLGLERIRRKYFEVTLLAASSTAVYDILYFTGELGAVQTISIASLLTT